MQYRTVTEIVEDVDDMRPRVVIVGAGCGGREAARALRLARPAAHVLGRLGVTVRTSAPVERVDAGSVVIGGERLAARTVIWAADVHASPAGAWLGAATDRAGRVRVGRDLSVPRHPEIFVIGETASVSQDGHPLPGVAAVANQEGRYVARVIAARATGSPPPRPFRYHDRGSLATSCHWHAAGKEARRWVGGQARRSRRRLAMPA
jgi:NADH:quinone reductase (non-electrogenic)